CKLNDRSPRKRRPAFMRVASTIPRSAEFCFELTGSSVAVKKKNLQFLENRSPAKSVLMSSSVIVTASEQAGWMHNPKRLIGISALPTLMTHRLIEVAPTRHTEQEAIKQAVEFFAKTGKETAIVQDRIGM